MRKSREFCQRQRTIVWLHFWVFVFRPSSIALHFHDVLSLDRYQVFLHKSFLEGLLSDAGALALPILLITTYIDETFTFEIYCCWFFYFYKTFSFNMAISCMHKTSWSFPCTVANLSQCGKWGHPNLSKRLGPCTGKKLSLFLAIDLYI